MSLTSVFEIAELDCVMPSAGIEICSVDQAGVTEFRIPASHETNLVYIAPNTVEDLFTHHFQTDQLLVVSGSIVLVVLLNGDYHYIVMDDRHPRVVKIPPNIPHGVINLSPNVCVAVNSIIRHGAPDERDYRSIKPPFPYHLSRVRELLEQAEDA
jgi:uncharacterized RmlC-like cupin family protein